MNLMHSEPYKQEVFIKYFINDVKCLLTEKLFIGNS